MNPYTDPMDVLIASGITVSVPGGIARDENGCAIWPFGKVTGGYGCYYFTPGEPVYVHRVVCSMIHGPIPAGWHVDHVWEQGCRSRACFWPDHLEAVTPAENARRMGLAKRQRGPRPCGHSWDDDRPGRPGDCAVCHREQEARRHAARPKPAHDRVRLIRQLVADRLLDSEIASLVGVTPQTVKRIRSGQSYANVR